MNKVKIITLAIALALATSSVHAGKSKKWRANNDTADRVKVFWTAAGCAGVKSACRNGENVYTVCKAEILDPGESSDYRFDDAASSRKKQVCSLDSASEVGYTSARKNNAVICSTSKCWFGKD